MGIEITFLYTNIRMINSRTLILSFLVNPFMDCVVLLQPETEDYASVCIPEGLCIPFTPTRTVYVNFIHNLLRHLFFKCNMP